MVGMQRHTLSYDTKRIRSRALNLRIYTSFRPSGLNVGLAIGLTIASALASGHNPWPVRPTISPAGRQELDIYLSNSMFRLIQEQRCMRSSWESYYFKCVQSHVTSAS
jgi:hypothetical protein